MLPSRKLNMHHIFNLSIQVSLMLKLIVQANLALICRIFFSSVEPERITSVGNSIPSKYLKLTLRCLECSLVHWVKCIYRKLRSVLGLLKKLLGSLKVVTKYICFSNLTFPLTFMKVWIILIQKNKDC